MKGGILIIIKRLCNLLVIPILIIPLLVSCKEGVDKKHKPVDKLRDLRNISINMEKLSTLEKSIFYGLYSPDEIKTVFSKSGTNFDPSILNSSENLSNYTSSSKIALNLGVYGADLSYIQLFSLQQESVNYWSLIENLISQLEIPDDIIVNSRKSFNQNINNPDSLIKIATNTFTAVNNHLQEQERESTAALILIGGWVETLSILTETFFNQTTPGIEIISLIAEQKYSLNFLISFIKNYHNDPVVADYYRKLRVLQNHFNEFYIYYNKNDIEVDTIKQIIKASGNRSDITKKSLLKIVDQITQIRNEIIY